MLARRSVFVPVLFALVAGLVVGPSTPAGAAPADAAPAVVSAAPADYHPVLAAHAFDTRSGVGTTRGAIPANRPRIATVTGIGGVPASGVGAVVLNVGYASATKAGGV